MLEQPLDFTDCCLVASSFFNSPPSLIHFVHLTQLVGLPWVTYDLLCSTCVTYGTLCHAIVHQVLPIQPLRREVEADFPSGGKYFNHVSLFT